MNWQRATTDDKKSERKEAIYTAALTLFKYKGYDKVSFNGIAAEAGFTKSNMYRYFTSKEEVFLNIFADLFASWVEDCSQRLQGLKPNTNITVFAQNWLDSLKAHPEFLDLTPILFTSLESNSSYEQLYVFKQQSMLLLFQLAQDVSRVYPELQDDKAFKYLTLSFAATTNYWAANSHNDALIKIYQQEEFQDLKPDFDRDLISSIEVIITGLKNQN